MKKKIVLTVILSLLSTLFASNVFAAKKDSAPKVLRVATLNGPTSIPIAYYYENKGAIKNVDVEIEICAAANIELPKLLKGEVDIGFLPPNAAAKVFTANKGSLVCLGISDNGNLSLIANDDSLKDLSGLKGKKVAVAGMASTPDYMFRYLLSKNGLEVGEGEDKVELDFSIPTAEIAAAIGSGKIQYAVVPEPFGTVATIKAKNVRKAIDLQKEFEKVEGAGKTYPITVIVAPAKFVKENPAIVKSFLASFKKAIDWTNANPKAAGEVVQKNTLGLQAAVVEKSIPSANFVYVPAKDGKAQIEKLLDIFLKLAPESIGGVLPADDFYYKGK